MIHSSINNQDDENDDNNNINQNDDDDQQQNSAILDQPLTVAIDQQQQQQQQSVMVDIDNNKLDHQEYKTFLKLHKLVQGVSYKNIIASYLGSFLSICFFVFINVAQPIILTNSLNIPDDKTGQASGNLSFANELVILIVSHCWGITSDRIGRKYVYCIGMVLIGMGLIVYPFANSFGLLILFRLIFALGAAACSSMLSAVLADYVIFQDRGKASGILGFSAGGGAVLGSLVLLKLPSFFQSVIPNFSITHAAQLTFCLTGGLAFIGAVILFFGLQNKKHCKTHTHERNSIKIAIEGIAAGKKPVLSLAYGSGFIARGDSAIATTFLSLWIYQYALSTNGGNKADALSQSGTISGVAQTCGLFFALIAGVLCDKLNRVFAMILLSSIGCLGYFLLSFSSNPLSTEFFIAACIIGCAETGMVVSSTALVAQESPPEYRGSVSGFFSQCGSIGILIASKVGGEFFDRWNGFPFVLFGALSGVLSLWGLIVFIFTQCKTKRSSNPIKSFFLNFVSNDDKEVSNQKYLDSIQNPLLSE
ncbi:hypothetical protein CYY_003073 [Polysphondylium violaceum]|uniref:Major facilitator superfamily (MFS) profile domain-containing protein n=1 Tax=Polysphondylium violaceum TaxID=133409 RepID=A0A8J4PYB0_9MYCE|nr:hypothetical protein CYY_003073 [Polysphondylium violaceum]